MVHLYCSLLLLLEFFFAADFHTRTPSNTHARGRETHLLRLCMKHTLSSPSLVSCAYNYTFSSILFRTRTMRKPSSTKLISTTVVVCPSSATTGLAKNEEEEDDNNERGYEDDLFQEQQEQEQYQYRVVDSKIFEGVEKEEEDQSCRITDALLLLFPERYDTKSSAKKAIRRGDVSINDEKCSVSSIVSTHKNGNEVFRIDIRARVNATNGNESKKMKNVEEMPKEIQPGNGENSARVVYEDEECAVVMKPFGIPTLKTKTSPSENNTNELSGWCLDRILPYVIRAGENVEGALHRPRPVHRLDSLTGGLVVVAKTRRASKLFHEAFRDRTARKRYRAVLIEYEGNERKLKEKSGTIKSNDMGEGGNLYAETDYEIVKEMECCFEDEEEEEEEENDEKKRLKIRSRCLVDFYPKTGRTHQLRKHAANQLGMPILGDTRYGGKIHNDFAKTNKPKLHLFAAEITMPIEATPWRVGQTCLNVKLEEPTFFS